MSLGHVAWPGIIQEAAGYVSQLHCSSVYFLLPNNRAYGQCTRHKYIVAIPLINRKKNPRYNLRDRSPIAYIPSTESFSIKPRVGKGGAEAGIVGIFPGV